MNGPVARLAIFALALSLILAAFTAVSAQNSPVNLPDTDRLPGVDLAEGLTAITGVAISPLLGVSSIGAWRYFKTPEQQRDQLPWFCHPLAWGIGFAVLLLCLLKDIFGTVAPPLVKKPLDMAELLENKASALVAAAAFIPFISAQVAQNFAAVEFTHHLAIANFNLGAMFPIGAISFDLRLLFIPLGIFTFFVVWLTSHAINVLIALSPFGIVDAILKAFKLAMFTAVVALYAISPLLGAALSLLIILIALFLAPAAFRLTVFGSLMAVDTIFRRWTKNRATPEQAHAFLVNRKLGAPKRTYGRVYPAADGTLKFSYRPWLVFPVRDLELPAGRIAIHKGLLYPSLLHSYPDEDNFSRAIIYLPRYRSHTEAIAAHCQISDIREGKLTRGLRAIRAWLSETLNSGQGSRSRYQEGAAPG